MLIALIVVLALALLVGWYVGGISLLLRLALGSPALTLAIPLIFLATLSRRFRPLAIGLTVLLTVADLVAYPVRMSSWAQTYEHTMKETPVAPDSNFQPRRVLPMEVADQFARSAQTDPRYSYGDLHPTLNATAAQTRLVWQSAARPTSFVGYWSSGLSSIVEVDADTTSPDVHVYNLNLPTGGEGNFNDFALVIHRSVDPLSEALPPVYDVHRKEAIVPLVRTIWGIPRLEGFAVFTSTGTVEKLSFKDAATRYPHLRLYPEDLVRWQSEAWGSWRSGFLGHFTNRNRFEVADIGSNPPPTLLDDTRRAAWVVPMEPIGRSYGLTGLLFVDPTTGTRTFWNTTQENVMSPSRALGVAEGDPRIAQLKNAEALEPRLAILHGQIHWLIPIAPSSRSQVQLLALVNAHDRTTVVAPTAAEIFAPPTQHASGLTAQAPTFTDRMAHVTELIKEVQAELDTIRATQPR